MIAVMIAMLFTRDLATQLYASLLSAAVVVAAYFLRSRRRGIAGAAAGVSHSGA